MQDEIALFSQSARPAHLTDVQPRDAAHIQYTSETTGSPKGATLDHQNLMNNARIYCNPKRVGHQSVYANMMPLFHTAGCAIGVLGCLQAACKMLLMKRFYAVVFARLIEEQCYNLFCGTYDGICWTYWNNPRGVWRRLR